MTPERPVYLDCNATTPVDPRVVELMNKFLVGEFGNAGSRTHIFGTEAARAVNVAREQLAAVSGDEPASVVFTSGATESNNLVILGLAAHPRVDRKKRHVVTTAIEHKAVLEPVEQLRTQGFEVTLVKPNRGGWVDPDEVASAVRDETLLVSVMHVNNETGIAQPLSEIAERLTNRDCYFHTDASQGFGKDLAPLKHRRIDMISISGHKLYGPKGIGALILRKRSFKRPPIAPLFHGGGQERGLRAGTLPVFLVVGLGLAAELANSEQQARATANKNFKTDLLHQISEFSPVIHGDQSRCLPSAINFSLEGIDSEAAMLKLKDHVAISNGSACTSAGHTPSHVLSAMGLSAGLVSGAMRWSWCHSTPRPDWSAIRDLLRQLR